MTDFITNAELRIEAERLVDENEELRELVLDLYGLLEMTMQPSAVRDATLARARASLRRLGIEVSR